MRTRRSRGFRPAGEHLDIRCLPSGFSPMQLTTAYGLGNITFSSSSGSKVTGDGTGQTIAIIDEYHDPNLQASLNAFDARYGLSNVTINVVNQAGNQTDSGWAVEETLDVEWAHAMAPGANIAVIEVSPGSSANQEFNNLMAAIRTASSMKGVSAVSMSWGYNEFSGETSYDSNFTTTGVTFIASSGDAGTVSWPSTSANVLSVGGTTLRLNGSGGYGSETGWSNAGGGLSTIVNEPTYQNNVQTTGQRSTPDVSFDANPNTGASIYVIPPDSTTGQGSWDVVGGTSLSAPAWAGIIAIVNQGRALAGQSPLTGSTETIPALYALPSTDFYKAGLSSGSGTNTAFSSSTYNTQAGLGSPHGANLINALVDNNTNTPSPPSSPSPTSPGGTPPGLLPRPHPIQPTPTPPPPVIGPPPAPLPTPTPSLTPPPAPPPQPLPVAQGHRHHHRAHRTRPAQAHHHNRRNRHHHSLAHHRRFTRGRIAGPRAQAVHHRHHRRHR